MDALALALLAAAGIVAVTVGIAFFTARLASRQVRWFALSIAWGIGAVVASIAFFVGVTAVPGAFAAPVIALGGLFGVVLTVPVGDISIRRLSIYSTIGAVVLFVPAVSLVFNLQYDPFATGIGYLDLGAVLPILAAASAVLVVMLLQRRSHGRDALSRAGWAVVWPAVLAWAGSVAWLVGMELAVDGHTPVILVDVLVMPIAAAGAWAAVERARHRSNSGSGIALGLVTGCAAAVPAAGYLIPLLAVVVALVVGAAAALVHPSARLRLPVSLLVGAGGSLVLLGLLAQNVAFIYTGQPEVLFTQALTVVLVVLAGAVVGLVGWLVTRPSRAA